MGDIVAVSDRGVDEKVIGTAGAGTDGTGGKSTSSTDTGTAGRTGAGTAGRTGADGTAERVTTKKSDELAILTDDEKKEYLTATPEEKKRIIRNAKRRERYAKEKTSQGGQVKPRKVNRKKSNVSQVDDTTVKALIATITGMVASRPNMGHWALTEKEIESIATPISNIIKEYDVFSNLTQYSNQIALVTACVTIFAPRVFMTVQIEKERKHKNVTGNVTNTNVKHGTDNGTQARGDQKVDRGNSGQPTIGSANHVDDVSIYGLPIT